MQLKRIDLVRDACPPGRAGKTSAFSDLRTPGYDLDMRVEGDFVRVQDRGSRLTVLIPLTNVARLEEHASGDKGKR